MKEIKAYIKHHKLNDVTLALNKLNGITGISVVDVRGTGRSSKNSSSEQESDQFLDFVSHVKLEIVCLDKFAEDIVSSIEETAHTGLKGDGKIYITNIENAIRIETGERGEDAV